jgi:hypothetical protein
VLLEPREQHVGEVRGEPIDEGAHAIENDVAHLT